MIIKPLAYVKPYSRKLREIRIGLNCLIDIYWFPAYNCRYFIASYYKQYSKIPRFCTRILWAAVSCHKPDVRWGWVVT